MIPRMISRMISHIMAALLLAAPAVAQPAPRVLPSRDVAVTYRVSGAVAATVPGGIPGPLHLAWDADGERLRAEADGRTQTALVDLRTQSANVIDSALRTSLSLPLRKGAVAAATLRGAKLTRRGRDTVAGLACTTYAIETPRGSGTVCLTEDGVPLSGQGTVDGRAGSFTATKVAYGEQPDALFRVPPDYVRLDMGNLRGALGRLGRLP